MSSTHAPALHRRLSGFKAHRFDLSLFDYLMPKMNGFEFCRAIERIDRGVNICVMSAYEAIPADKRSDKPDLPSDPKFVLKNHFD